MRALLMSSSVTYEQGTLGHAAGHIGELLDGTGPLVFVPYALTDWDGYTASVRDALADACDVRGAHTLSVAQTVRASAFYVGGGNTFRLLRALQDTGLLGIIRSAVAAGALYLGDSAGSAVAGPTMRTTNDMPIVEPRSLTALGLVGWHMNCHYPDPQPGPRTFMAETREERLAEFLEENDSEVVCLREPAWLDIDGTRATVGGRGGGRLFRRGAGPVELAAGDTSRSLARWVA
ncbi:MAG TPA: dipeptidase PepE [Streptosporangiaceae bacterium]|jgi:dipeptidase E